MSEATHIPANHPAAGAPFEAVGYLPGAQIDDLGVPGLELAAPIPVIVQKEDGMFVVSFNDAEVYASGETLADALGMLKDMTAFSYKFLTEKQADLDEDGRRSLAALRRYIRS